MDETEKQHRMRKAGNYHAKYNQGITVVYTI